MQENVKNRIFSAQCDFYRFGSEIQRIRPKKTRFKGHMSNFDAEKYCATRQETPKGQIDPVSCMYGPLPFLRPSTGPRSPNSRKLLWRLPGKLPAKLGALEVVPGHAPQQFPQRGMEIGIGNGNFWESAKVSHKRVFALLTPENPHLEIAQMLQKPVFALPGCQRMSVNTLLCDTLGLAELH